MNIAQAMYLGGATIHANSPRLNSFSYQKLGLRCTYCGEPVYYRKGGINQPHFSHFPPSKENKVYEECPLRQKNIGGTSSPNYNSWFGYSGKGQRLSLFQKHFISIIRSEIPTLNISSLETEYQEVELSKLQIKALGFARNNKNGLLRYLKIFNDQIIELEKMIICEAFDYLIIDSSRNLFKIISIHVIKQSNFFNSGTSRDSSFKRLCHLILNFLTTINWTNYFVRITKIEPPKIATEPLKLINLIQELGTRSSLYIYLYQNQLWLGEIESFYIKSEKLLGFLDQAKLIKSKWAIKKAEKAFDKIIEPDKLFSIVAKSEQYNRYKRLIKESVIPEAYIKLEKIARETDARKPQHQKESKHLSTKENRISFDRTVHEFWISRKAKIFLYSQTVSICLAEISINDAAIQYRTIYRFNSEFLTLREEYNLSVKENSAIEASFVEVIQKVYELVKSRKNHRISKKRNKL